MTAKWKSTATFSSVSDTMSSSLHCFLYPRKSSYHISQSNLTAYSIWILTYALIKAEGSASHLVELILDLTTNIQDRAVVEVNYILGCTEKDVLHIPSTYRSPCQNKPTNKLKV